MIINVILKGREEPMTINCDRYVLTDMESDRGIICCWEFLKNTPIGERRVALVSNFELVAMDFPVV